MLKRFNIVELDDVVLKARKKPYGHTAYTRRDPRTGKLIQVRAKGVRAAMPDLDAPKKKRLTKKDKKKIVDGLVGVLRGVQQENAAAHHERFSGKFPNMRVSVSQLVESSFLAGKFSAEQMLTVLAEYGDEEGYYIPVKELQAEQEGLEFMPWPTDPELGDPVEAYVRLSTGHADFRHGAYAGRNEAAAMLTYIPRLGLKQGQVMTSDKKVSAELAEKAEASWESIIHSMEMRQGEGNAVKERYDVGDHVAVADGEGGEWYGNVTKRKKGKYYVAEESDEDEEGEGEWVEASKLRFGEWTMGRVGMADKNLKRFNRAIQKFRELGVFDFDAANGNVEIEAQGRLSRDFAAYFQPKHQRPGSIQLGNRKDNPSWESFGHEFGHYLDWKLQGYAYAGQRAGTFASHTGGTPVQKFADKLLQLTHRHNPEVFSHFKKIRQRKHLTWLNTPTEAIARFANEWLHRRWVEATFADAPQKDEDTELTHAPGNHTLGRPEWTGLDSYKELSAEFEKLLDDAKVPWRPIRKALVVDLAKGKPYGHTAYTRRDPRSGKLVQVGAKGVKPKEDKTKPGQLVLFPKKEAARRAEKPKPKKEGWARYPGVELEVLDRVFGGSPPTVSSLTDTFSSKRLGWGVQVASAHASGSEFEVQFSILDDQGNIAGKMTRTFARVLQSNDEYAEGMERWEPDDSYDEDDNPVPVGEQDDGYGNTLDDTELVVEHSYFSLDVGYQGKGFAAEIFEQSVETYNDMGASAVIVHANMSVGGYAWAKFGFEFADQDTVHELRQAIEEELYEQYEQDYIEDYAEQEREHYLTEIAAEEANDWWSVSREDEIVEEKADKHTAEWLEEQEDDVTGEQIAKQHEAFEAEVLEELADPKTQLGKMAAAEKREYAEQLAEDYEPDWDHINEAARESFSESDVVMALRELESPREFAALTDGGTKIGKEAMLGTSWAGYLPLDAGSSGYQAYQYYIEEKRKQYGFKKKLKKADGHDDKADQDDPAWWKVAKKLGIARDLKVKERLKTLWSKARSKFTKKALYIAKAKPKGPGSRGGKYWVDDKGKVRYGKRTKKKKVRTVEEPHPLADIAQAAQKPKKYRLSRKEKAQLMKLKKLGQDGRRKQGLQGTYRKLLAKQRGDLPKITGVNTKKEQSRNFYARIRALELDRPYYAKTSVDLINELKKWDDRGYTLIGYKSGKLKEPGSQFPRELRNRIAHWSSLLSEEEEVELVRLQKMGTAKREEKQVANRYAALLHKVGQTRFVMQPGQQKTDEHKKLEEEARRLALGEIPLVVREVDPDEEDKPQVTDPYVGMDPTVYQLDKDQKHVKYIGKEEVVGKDGKKYTRYRYRDEKTGRVFARRKSPAELSAVKPPAEPPIPKKRIRKIGSTTEERVETQVDMSEYLKLRRLPPRERRAKGLEDKFARMKAAVFAQKEFSEAAPVTSDLNTVWTKQKYDDHDRRVNDLTPTEARALWEEPNGFDANGHRTSLKTRLGRQVAYIVNKYYNHLGTDGKNDLKSELESWSYLDVGDAAAIFNGGDFHEYAYRRFTNQLANKARDLSGGATGPDGVPIVFESIDLPMEGFADDPKLGRMVRDLRSDFISPDEALVVKDHKNRVLSTLREHLSEFEMVLFLTHYRLTPHGYLTGHASDFEADENFEERARDKARKKWAGLRRKHAKERETLERKNSREIDESAHVPMDIHAKIMERQKYERDAMSGRHKYETDVLSSEVEGGWTVPVHELAGMMRNWSNMENLKPKQKKVVQARLRPDSIREELAAIRSKLQRMPGEQKAGLADMLRTAAKVRHSRRLPGQTEHPVTYGTLPQTQMPTTKQSKLLKPVGEHNPSVNFWLRNPHYLRQAGVSFEVFHAAASKMQQENVELPVVFQDALVAAKQVYSHVAKFDRMDTRAIRKKLKLMPGQHATAAAEIVISHRKGRPKERSVLKQGKTSLYFQDLIEMRQTEMVEEQRRLQAESVLTDAQRDRLRDLKLVLHKALEIIDLDALLADLSSLMYDNDRVFVGKAAN